MKVGNEKIVRGIIIGSAIFTIIIQSYMDLNETHMTNPLWAPHARFHWSIQYYMSMMINAVSLYLMWGKYEGSGSRLTIIFATLGPLLFWVNFFPSLLMPGTSAWPDGVIPFIAIAPNVIIAGIISLLCGFALYLDGRNRRIRESDSGVIPK